MHVLLTFLLGLFAPREDERGDVPGWVMVTLMTAGLVVLIWAFAGDLLVDMFQDAMNRVTDGG